MIPAVAQSRYRDPATSPQAGTAGAAACTGHANPSKPCPHCGTTILRPRRNQTYCSKQCREAATEQKRHRNVPKKTACCPYCGNQFDLTRKARTFCSPVCQQAFSNFWKAKGPALAMAMIEWRVGKKPGAFTKVCQEFSRAREDLADKRSKAHAAKGNTVPTTTRRKTP